MTVSVVVPARNEAETIGATIERIEADQVIVVDASSDGTAELAARAGAEVHPQQDLLPQFGPVLGKGDAMWRTLSVVRGDVVVYLDADSENFGEHFVTRLVEPLEGHGIEFVKAHYRRPFKVGSEQLPEGGGRVTELTAKPLLKAFFPELADIHQPLAGEVAARRSLLERIPFATGYAVEMAMLIDVWREVGRSAIAQADLDVRQNRHQPLAELRPMAETVLGVVLGKQGLGGHSDLVERPPMAAV